MNAPLIDPELLASVIDGTATPDERAAAMRILASSREAHAIFVDAVAIHRELAAETGAAASGANEARDSVVLVSRRKGRWRYVAPIALVAATIAIVVFLRGTGRPDATVSLAVVPRLEGATGAGSLARTLGAGWDVPGWSVSRGSESTQIATRRAFRIGVRLAQLEIAARASDSVAVMAATSQIRELLSDVAGAAPVASRLDSMGRESSFGSDASRGEIGLALKGILQQPAWFDLGVWTGAAQIAIHSGHREFFTVDGGASAQLAHLLTERPQQADAWDVSTASLRDLPRDDASRVEAITRAVAQVMASAGG